MSGINIVIALIRAILALPYTQGMHLDSMKGRCTVPLLPEHAFRALSKKAQLSVKAAEHLPKLLGYCLSACTALALMLCSGARGMHIDGWRGALQLPLQTAV